MRVISSGIVNGEIQDQYGKRGTQFNEYGVPSCSLPFEVLDAPEGTRSFAIILEDKDAIPVTNGFPWIHWVACNIRRTRVSENESQGTPDFVQGLNSYTSLQGGSLPKEACCCYCGMGAPDCPHLYELHVFALDTVLPLCQGFWMNELWKAMKGHILDSDTLEGLYKN